MKLFWSLIAIIVLGAAAYLAADMLRGPDADSSPAPTILLEPDPPSPATNATPPPGPAPQLAPTAPAAESSVPSPASTNESSPVSPASDDKTPADAVPAQPIPEATEPDPPSAESSDAPVTPTAPATPAAQSDAEPKPTNVTADQPPESVAANPPVTEVKVEKREDGSLLLDDKYIITGEGTREKPYKLTWDLLLSVSHDYSPRDGKKLLPGRITMFDGTWVEMTGYIAFPIISDQSDELLSMMNQWDGCCIGVPPTPYDAIEVRLGSPVTGAARFTTYGTVAGRLKVEPSLVGTWVVGLYVMDSATMTPKAIGATAP